MGVRVLYHCYQCRVRVGESELIRQNGLGFCSHDCAHEASVAALFIRNKVLNKMQHKLLQPMVSFGWLVYHYPQQHPYLARWDDDPGMPVKVGKVMNELLIRGLVERNEIVEGLVIYRASASAKTDYRCPNCYFGYLVNERGSPRGYCQQCLVGCLDAPSSVSEQPLAC